MDHKICVDGEGGGSIHLEVGELRRLSETTSKCATMFEPRRGLSSLEKRDSGEGDKEDSNESSTTVRAPEKKLTLFALRLAVLEKAATGLGTLGFIWATVVLLGGFAITLDKTDFWFITIILLIEGTRIFSRSHELEWQHQATWSITESGMHSFRMLRSSSNSILQSIKNLCRPINAAVKKHRKDTVEANVIVPRFLDNRITRTTTRTWISSDVPLLPYAKWFFISGHISKVLYWLQLLSATACVVLSSTKLIRHNYGVIAKGDTDKRNRESALDIFYALDRKSVV